MGRPKKSLVAASEDQIVLGYEQFCSAIELYLNTRLFRPENAVQVDSVRQVGGSLQVNFSKRAAPTPQEAAQEVVASETSPAPAPMPPRLVAALRGPFGGFNYKCDRCGAEISAAEQAESQKCAKCR